jgi:tRNA threonylcarbamoyladenosine biosynthesis protein TsaB
LLILGLDTASRATAVALVRAGETPAGRAGGAAVGLAGEPPLELEARDDPPPGARPRHATRLLELIADVLHRGEVGWEAVDRIAVGVGPGTFTGLRIGIASARALARARGIDLVGVSTLRSVATHAISATNLAGAESVLAVLDARRGEVFAAAWRRDDRGDADAEILAPRACDPEALAARVGGLGACTLAVGEGAVEFREVLERAGALIPGDESELHRVSAISHCRLALSMRASSPDQVCPAYLRLPDAEISRRAANSR